MAGDSQQSKPRRAQRLRYNLFACVVDGALFSVMVGIGESYLALFVLAVGGSKVAAGLVTTVPYLFGAVLGLLSPIMVRALGSHRRFIVICASIQAASFIPLIFMAATHRVWMPGIFIAATFYWGSGMASASAWNTWIGLIIPPRIRSRYFGRRAPLCHLGTILGLASGGLILERFGDGQSGGTPIWFALLFGVASLCRIGSTLYLASQTDTGPVPEDHRDVGPTELLGRLRHGRDGRFLVYMMFMQVGVQIAQPFLIPFIREGLHSSYVEYLILIGASFVAKAVFQPLWGAFCHKYGALKLLWIGGLGLVPLSGLWLVPIWAHIDGVFWYMLLTQLISGALWAAYEQAVLLMMFDAIREKERTSLWATFNVGNAAAMVGGSLLGAWLLGQSNDLNAYASAFGLSIAVRLATVVYLARAHDLLEPPQLIVRENVHLGEGALEIPVLSTMTTDAGTTDAGKARSG